LGGKGHLLSLAIGQTLSTTVFLVSFNQTALRKANIFVVFLEFDT
jgi:hypothetical protein